MRAIIKTAICPLHTKPDSHSELADEALYGMIVELLEQTKEGWYKVRTHYRYEGYAPSSCLLIEDTTLHSWAALPKKVILHKNTCDILFQPKVQSWPLITLTRGAVVSPVGEAKDGWQEVTLCDGLHGYTRSSFLDKYHKSSPYTDESALRHLLVTNAMRYEGSPYRWGGKTPLGIDCSGLVFMAYLLSGIIIYRNAHIMEGFPIHPIPLEQAKAGDLLFFPGHVAMYIGGGHYVHSTGHQGDDGFAHNSLNPGDPDFRAELREQLIAVGSYF